MNTLDNKTYVWMVAAAAAILAIFVLAPTLYSVKGLGSYLPLHMFMETASIIVSFMIFGVVWNAYSQERAGNIVMLATGLMAAGLIDFAHMLSYHGMPVFVSPGHAEKAINFWLAARFLTALTLLVAAVRPWRPFASTWTRHVLLAVALVITVLVYWAGLFHEDAWPQTFIEGQGLTDFKVLSEYLIVTLFSLAAILFFRQARTGRYPIAGSLAAAAAISALSELSFTLYSDVTDIYNFLGHLYKIFAFMLVYSSVFVGSVREPFERLREEEAALTESQERLQAVFDTAQDGIVVASRESGRFILANSAFCNMLGISGSELQSLGVDDIHPRDRLEEIKQQFQRQARGEVQLVHDIPVLRRDGTIIYCDFNASPLDIDGEPALLGMVRDVTSRRQMEQEIRAGREQLEMALHGARDGVFDWDIEKDRVYYSPRWKELLGYSDDEIGTDRGEWQGRIHPEDIDSVTAAIEGLLGGQSSHLKSEYRMQHRDGYWVWMLARGQLVRDKQGQPERLVGTHVDISDIKAAEQNEQRALLQLGERLKEMQCLYGVTALGSDVERPLDEILATAVGLLPPAWQFPDDTCARIRFDDSVHCSSGFVETEWSQQAAIRVHGTERGDVMVCYRTQQPTADEGPFLKEERSLINSVASQLGIMIALREGQAALVRVNQILTTLSESNLSLVRAPTEQRLTESMCKILVRDGNYSLVWIAYLDEASNTLHKVAAESPAGTSAPAFDTVDIGNSDSLLARAVTSGKDQVWQRADPADTVLVDGVDLTDICVSAIALPLGSGDWPLGVMLICSADFSGMDSREVNLFRELAGDLSYGINTLRIRDERDDALGALEGVLFQTIDAISRTVEKRDPYTAGHQQRVAILAEAIGREMGLDESLITGLRLGSMIHDIGKIYIPAEVLNRPGKLSESEFGLIKSHPLVGYEIIKDVEFHWPVKEMIRQHHERLDGSGYPDGLKGEAIIIEARILAVADVVEAIAAHRPYRPALGVDKALEVIQEGRGVLYDERVVDTCVALFEEKGFHWD